MVPEGSKREKIASSMESCRVLVSIDPKFSYVRKALRLQSLPFYSLESNLAKRIQLGIQKRKQGL